MTSDDITRRRLLRMGGGTVAAVGVGGFISARGINQNTTGNTTDNNTEASRQNQDGGQYTSVYNNTIDSVVLVNVFTGGVGSESGGLGSGFVIDDTHVVTNNHVVSNATKVELQFSNEQWRSASIVGTDIHSDLAVLSVDGIPDSARGLSFTDSKPAVGQEVLALGNPLGLDASISQGIVSGVDRSLPSPYGFSIPAAIQTDAPVNPGNSGGPLVNLEGDVLGVVFAGAGQAIGFAISAGIADRVVPALIKNGEYQHPYMGVSVMPVGPVAAEANGLNKSRGVLVVDVVSGAPADGVLQPADDTERIDGQPIPVGGDVIVAINGQNVPNQERLSSMLALETSPGETISIEVLRDGKQQTVKLTLKPRPKEGSLSG